MLAADPVILIPDHKTVTFAFSGVPFLPCTHPIFGVLDTKSVTRAFIQCSKSRAIKGEYRDWLMEKGMEWN
jgi:hypothetical protein